MLMSDLTHSSLACKAHLNMSIGNALYKFITITIKICHLRTADCRQFLTIHVILRANPFLYGNHFPKNFVTDLLHDASRVYVTVYASVFCGNLLFGVSNHLCDIARKPISISHDVTKIRTTKLLIFLRFYINDV